MLSIFRRKMTAERAGKIALKYVKAVAESYLSWYVNESKMIAHDDGPAFVVTLKWYHHRTYEVTVGPTGEVVGHKDVTHQPSRARRVLR